MQKCASESDRHDMFQCRTASLLWAKPVEHFQIDVVSLRNGTLDAGWRGNKGMITLARMCFEH